MCAEKPKEIKSMGYDNPISGKAIEFDKEKEWKKFVEELVALKTRIYEKINVKLSENGYDGEGEKWTSMRTDPFEKILKSMYQDFKDYAAYHILFGSSPIFEKSPKLDFPEEENSVKSFLHELEQEFDKWEEFVRELKSLRDRVYKKAGDKSNEELFYFQEKAIIPFVEKMRENCTGYDGYMAYHILICSSEIRPLLDFSPPYSIKEFLLKYERDLGVEDKKGKFDGLAN